METSLHSYIRRVAENLSNETEVGDEDLSFEDSAPAAASDDVYDFNSRVFWAVNAFITCLFLVLLCWCCFGNKDFLTNMHRRREETDRAYQATVREREARRKRSKVMSPDQRKRKIIQSFKRHQVRFSVEESHLIPEDPNSHMDAEHADGMDHENHEASITSFNNAGHLQLPTGAMVPNCCAICLGDYDVGDEVVWSSNKKCPHAFHQECILDWLIKMQPETPCPCCRQEFTDLETLRKEAKILWAGDAFNLRNINL